MRTILSIFTLLLCAQTLISQETSLRLAPLFTDNMVLQQKTVAPVWGSGVPGTQVALTLSWGEEVKTLVQPDGSWMVKIRTPRAGGPYQIAVRDRDTSIALKNVVAGEVWLCSGQSNMEMPLEGWPPDTILNSAAEIKNSSYPDVRLFTVRRAYAATPQSQCVGSWEVCSPENSATFSASAYFFGRELHRTLKVPIGLIHTSWGGTPIEAWTSGKFLSGVAQFDTVLQKIRVAADSMKVLQKWLLQFPVIDMSMRDRTTGWQNLTFMDGNCSSQQYKDSAWRTMTLPTLWERTSVGEFDGAVWFRKHITVPATWMHRNLVVELGPIDDIDVTYVNGVKVGGYEGRGMWNVDRVYKIPKNLVDTTTLCIAVRVIDYGGGGGIYGEAKSMCIHPEGEDERRSLAGEWKYLPVAEYRGDKFFVLGSEGEQFFKRPILPIDFSAYAPTALYNGMIAPLVPFSLAGVIWYQGEANTNAPQLYRTLFPLMIENWRSVFKANRLPLYFVQIAPYAYGVGTESQYLREAQYKTLAVKNTGMAVTLDIGNARNIHPANKQEVGRRLALWALAQTYGTNLECSGPLYRSSKKFKDRIELSFDHARGGLVLIGAEQGNGFQIAGDDRIFKYAEVRVKGSRLVISNPEIVDPQAVRYAFSDIPQATLFNTEGLPSPSFRTDDWNR
jgi:sialate O-acetylesterase